MQNKLWIVLLFLFAFSFSAIAQEQEEFEIAADEIIHLQEGNQIIAQGNVEIHYTNYILKTDRLVYLIDEERLVTKDKVNITYANGTKLDADEIDVTTNLYNITGKNIKMMFATGAQFSATGVKKRDDGALRLKNASYTACKQCFDEEGNEKPLVWTANANNITHNEAAQTIAYKSLWLEMFDVPVLYLPYFYHPDPSVKRKSGFLFPSMGGNANIGEYISTPFFLSISDYSDLTLTPKFATDHDPILSGLYRHKFTNGFITASGMATKNDEKGFRGQIDLSAKFDINDTWRTNIDFNRVSDDTVLKYYDLEDSGRAWMESKATIEGFTKNSNLSFNLLSFQDLRSDVNDESIPDVIPYIEYNRTFNNLPYGTFLDVHANVLDMERGDDFHSTRRIATTIEYTKPYISPFGALFNFSAFAATNFYSISDYEYEQGETFSGNKMFFIPNLIMDIRYPFAKKQESSYQVIEPVVQFIAAPNSNISDKIPNEDSQDFEFLDSTVLQQNHFSGFDRYDIGSRINYGVNWSTYGQKTGKTSIFIGQSFRFSDNYQYPRNAGFEKNISDIVGNVFINPSSKLFIDYRFRLNNDNFEPQHNELTVSAGTPAFKMYLDYLFLKSTTTEISDLDDREEINIGFRSKLTKHWNISGYFQRDLEENRNVEMGGKIYYDDECFQTGIEVERNFTYDRDYSDGLSIKYNIIFKTISDSASFFNFGDFND